MTDSNGGEPRGPVALLRRAARGLQRVVECTLHTARRRRARRWLRGLRNPSSVLFICHGNICRSPYAEAVLRSSRALQGRNISVGSAGFIGPGRPSPAEALAVAERRGVDLTAHESRTMHVWELRDTDVVVVMDARQQRAVAARSGRPHHRILVLGDLDPHWLIRRRTIQDPWGQDEATFERVYERVDRCVDELARLLA